MVTMSKRPNVIYIFGDQWRQQATGYAGDPNVETPHIDELARQSVNFTHAVAGCPVCSPARASLLTGQRPLTHGVFVNDVSLSADTVSMGHAFGGAGYDTAYIGKWHVGGRGRSSYIEPRHRMGFDYWKVLECTHDYNRSAYYAGDSDRKLHWEGYDAIEQTRDAEAYIRDHAGGGKPFLLMLSWGPPHAPYGTAPESYRALYDAETIELRPNVPDETAKEARQWLAGYYAHCSALDVCLGDVLAMVRACGIEDDTILVFTSDHGDMLGSQGHTKKQRPWDESIRVPFLLRYPRLPGWEARETDALIDAPDIMPTLLGLCGIDIPDRVEGLDFSGHIAGGDDPSDGSALISCAQPFGQWARIEHQGREYRGLRTKRYTYVRDLEGPWLLYDNEADPYQMRNLVDDAEAAAIQNELDAALDRKLADQGDAFRPGMEYVERWGYTVDETGTVPYTD
ncbi:MAG: sulfatase [Planctomycetaceae bacterium]|nr:sulfatase [Planctomycetaceae bacterium]